MEASKRKRLEEAGWQVGSAQEFLDLSREEAELVERRVAGRGREEESRDADRRLSSD